MNRAAFALLAVVVVAVDLAGCSSSNHGNAKVIQPEITIEQLVGPAELNYPSGPIEVQFRVQVANKSGETITLKRIQLRSSSGGGAYQLRPDFYTFTQPVAPDRFESVTFWAKAYAYGRTLRENEPVTIRGIAYFDSPVGSFQQIFLRELNQYGGGRE